MANGGITPIQKLAAWKSTSDPG